MDIMQQLSTSYPGKFFAYAVNMFFKRYGEGAYYDAAVWARRVAEVYCTVLVDVLGQGDDTEYLGLYELIRQLPEWVWPYSAWTHVHAYGEGSRGQQFGMQLSSVPVWQDLEVLRNYGNHGAHASAEYLTGAKLAPNPQVVVCVIRVAWSFICWYKRIAMSDSAAFAKYRSKM